jgi:hypothetical protein
MGFLELYLIYSESGVWEEEWRTLQAFPDLVEQLPSVSREEMEQALVGWTRPLVNALGPLPQGLLLKLPTSTRLCWARSTCPFYRARDCVSTSKKTPWCFAPDGIEDESIRRLMAEVIRLWREGVYTVVVREAPNAQ